VSACVECTVVSPHKHILLQVSDDEVGDATMVRIWGAEPDVEEAAGLLAKLLARSQVLRRNEGETVVERSGFRCQNSLCCFGLLHRCLNRSSASVASLGTA
jgi:hypothetical protein